MIVHHGRHLHIYVHVQYSVYTNVTGYFFLHPCLFTYILLFVLVYIYTYYILLLLLLHVYRLSLYYPAVRFVRVSCTVCYDGHGLALHVAIVFSTVHGDRSAMSCTVHGDRSAMSCTVHGDRSAMSCTVHGDRSATI